MAKVNKNAPKYVVGLDIGTTKIAVVVGCETPEGKIDIVGYGKSESHGVTRGFVANIDLTVDAINTAVQQAKEMSNVDIKHVIVGIAGQYVKCIQQRGHHMRMEGHGEITQEDIDKLMESMEHLAINPGEQIIDVVPQEYIIDGEPGIKNPVGMVGTTIETNFHIITAQTSAVNNIKTCINRAGLIMDKLILEPIASSYAVLTEEEQEAGVVLVDIGGGTTDVAIYHDCLLRYTSVIPFGGEVITNDIKEGCQIIRRYAEDLKVKFGSALVKKNREEDIVVIPGLHGRPPREISLVNLASIIQSRMEEILEQVAFEIRSSGFDKKLVAGIVVTGGGSVLKHIIQLTEFVTGKGVRIGYPNEFMEQGANQVLNSPIFATVIGLLRMGLEMEKQKKKAMSDMTVNEDSDDKDGEGDEEEVVKPKRQNFFDRFLNLVKEIDSQEDN